MQKNKKKTKVLWVTFHFPPRQSSGVFRPAKMYKYLDKTDLEIDFLTLTLQGKYRRATQDRSLLDEMKPTPAIYRVPSPELEDLVRIVTNALRRDKQVPRWTTGASSPERGRRRPLSRLKSMLKSVYRQFIMVVLFPDQYCLWGWLATFRGLGLHLRHRYDLVYTTSNPQSGHLPGLVLQLFGVSWIADYRDGGSLWNAQMMRYPKGKIRRSLEHQYQRIVMRRADVVLSQSETLGDQFAEEFSLSRDRIRAIPNGYDESDFSEHRPNPNLFDGPEEALHLLHVGLWYLDDKETVQLIAALNILEDQLAAIGGRLVFHGVGDYELFSEEQKETCLKFGYRYHGTVPHDELIPYLLSCDCYLLSTSLSMVIEGARGVLAGKLWEYLRGGKPILMFGPKDEAWGIVEEAGVGVDMKTLRAGETRVAECLCTRRSAPARPAPCVRRHSWKSRAHSMQEVFARVVEGSGDS